EERARLLEVSKRQARIEATLLSRRAQLKSDRDEALALQSRVREFLAKAQKGEAEPESIDLVYEEVREALRATRNSLGRTLATPDQGKSEVPGPGHNRLEGVLQDIDQSAAKATRRKVEETQNSLRLIERELWVDLAADEFIVMETLNNLRLELVPHLSGHKRTTVTGLGPGGLDQALSEAKHVMLVLLYHHDATIRWLQNLTKPTAARGKSALAATLIALKWMLPIGIFGWWRRRASRLLESADKKIREDLEEQRLRSNDSHPLLRTLRFIGRIRNPLEWLLLIWAFVWFLPPEAKGLLEVELV